MHEPVSRQPLAQQVLRSLGRRIAADNLSAGDRLPTERELAAELRVSRNTVREALRSLEAIGALARRPKRGSVLQAVDFSLVAEISQALMMRSPADLHELLVARRLLEVGLLPIVAECAVAADYAAMECANRQIESEVAAGGLPVEGDLAFHSALLRASHNRFLIQFGTLLEGFFRAVRPRVVANDTANRRTLEEHRAIVRALQAKDIRRARRIMEEHLDPYGHSPTSRPAHGAAKRAAGRTKPRSVKRRS
jgi:GntR family transcriptional regulator, transcriptional repressor for pyruvate dehydrogenase complex